MNIYDIQNKLKSERITIFDLPLKVCFYARVSTTLDAQLNSIDNQQQFFVEYINKQPNWEFVKGYSDEIRGESAKNRPQFLQMINDSKNGKVDLIVTKEISRFSRNTLDSLKYTQELYRSGVGVYFLNDNICTLDTDSELRLTIMSSIAQDEVRKLSERIKFGHKQAIANGRVLGNNRIFGYDLVDCKLQINVDEAKMVKKIYELFCTGRYSLRDLEKYIYSLGYKGRNGTKIMHNTLGNIIKNPKYKGYYCGNKVKSSDYKEQKQIFLPEEQWVMYKDERIAPIVSEELWQSANLILTDRSDKIKNNRSSIKKNSPFTGKLWCKEHDVPFWKNSRSKGECILWQCSLKRRQSASACVSPNIYEDELYRLLAAEFKMLKHNFNQNTDMFYKLYDKTNKINNNKSDIKDIQNNINKIDNKISSIIDMVLDGTLDKSLIKDKVDTLNKHKDEELQKLESATITSNQIQNKLNTLQDIVKFFNAVTNEELTDIDKPSIDKMMDRLVNKIIMEYDNVNKEYTLNVLFKNDINRIGTAFTPLHSVQMIKKMVESYKSSVK